MTNELTQKLESLGYTPPANDLLEWALGELPHGNIDQVYIVRTLSQGKILWAICYSPTPLSGYLSEQAFENANTPTQAALKLLITLKDEGVL